MIVTSAWVLALMTTLTKPHDTTRAPWLPVKARESADDAQARYTHIAEAVAEVAESPEEAAHLIVRSWLESGWRKDVDLGQTRGAGVDSCLMQVRVLPGTKTAEGWTWQELVSDRKKCFTAGVRILRNSLSVCKSVPANDRLSAYIAGTCHSSAGRRRSREHMQYVKRILQRAAKLESKEQADG